MCQERTCVSSGICPYGGHTAEPREVKEEGTEAELWSRHPVPCQASTKDSVKHQSP